MEIADCRCPQSKCSESFRNSKKKFEDDSIFSRVDNLTSTSFIRIDVTIKTYYKSCKKILGNYF